VFVARPPAKPSRQQELCLERAVRRSFTGPAEFLADPANRARVGEYLADMTRPYAIEMPDIASSESPALGHSYGEMAQALIGSVTSADKPVDLLVLAFAVHDLWPGRQTAAYLSNLVPGAPMAFAVCDQGSAAAFSALRIARGYASSAAIRRALLIVVEQAALPYSSPATLPSEHRGVAMLFGDGPVRDGHAGDSPAGDGTAGDDTAPRARLAGLRQHADVAPGDVAGLAAADLAELAAGHHEVVLVLGDALAGVWPAPGAGRVRVMPPGQPSTGVWWGLIDELRSGAGRPDLLVAADYDPGLRYLCLTALDTATS
jgi:hypothetical protein